MSESADVFITAGDGNTYWGRYGAAGALIAAPTGRILLQLRSTSSHSGGTWGLPGGALEPGESPAVGALRELYEEVAMPQVFLEQGPCWRLDRGGWTYTTVFFRAPGEFPAAPGNWESDEVRWVGVTEADSLPLHRGFAESWPGIRAELSW